MSAWRYDIEAAGGAAGTPAFFFIVTAEGPEGGKTVRQVGEAWRHEDGLIYWASQGPESEDEAITSGDWEIIAWQPMPEPAPRNPNPTPPKAAAPAKQKPGLAFVPLSRLALLELKRVCRGPVPRFTIANKRVASRLLDELLVTVEQRPSPVDTHRGKMIDHFVATDTGRARAAAGES